MSVMQFFNLDFNEQLIDFYLTFFILSGARRTWFSSVYSSDNGNDRWIHIYDDICVPIHCFVRSVFTAAQITLHSNLNNSKSKTVSKAVIDDCSAIVSTLAAERLILFDPFCLFFFFLQMSVFYNECTSFSKVRFYCSLIANLSKISNVK